MVVPEHAIWFPIALAYLSENGDPLILTLILPE